MNSFEEYLREEFNVKTVCSVFKNQRRKEKV